MGLLDLPMEGAGRGHVTPLFTLTHTRWRGAGSARIACVSEAISFRRSTRTKEQTVMQCYCANVLIELMGGKKRREGRANNGRLTEVRNE